MTLFTTEPSGAVNNDLICFSPTIEDFNNSKSSITNLGSGLPDPNGESEFISEKKFSLRADGEILESKNKIFDLENVFWNFINFLTINSLNSCIFFLQY